MAADPTVTALSAAVPLVIGVGDVNDNSPVFPAGSDVIRVSHERVGVGRAVGRVEARDADDGPNGDVFYWAESIDNSTADLFTIDPRSGQITVNADVEEPEVGESVVYTLSVTASDLGDPPRRTHLLLNVIIERQSHLGPGYRVSGGSVGLIGWKWIALTVAIIVVSVIVVIVLLVAICVAASGRRHQTDNYADTKTTRDADATFGASRKSYNCRRRELEAEEEAATRTALIVADCSETSVPLPLPLPVVSGEVAAPQILDVARTDKTAPETDCEVFSLAFL